MDWPLRTLTKEQSHLLEKWNTYQLKGEHLEFFMKVLYTDSDELSRLFNYNNLIAFLDDTTYYALIVSPLLIETALDDIIYDINEYRRKNTVGL